MRCCRSGACRAREKSLPSFDDLSYLDGRKAVAPAFFPAADRSARHFHRQVHAAASSRHCGLLVQPCTAGECLQRRGLVEARLGCARDHGEIAVANYLRKLGQQSERCCTCPWPALQKRWRLPCRAARAALSALRRWCNSDTWFMRLRLSPC